MCANVCACEPVDGHGGNGRALGPGDARKVACLPACLHPCLLSILLCSCPVRVCGRAHVYVCLCGCVCVRRGARAGFARRRLKRQCFLLSFCLLGSVNISLTTWTSRLPEASLTGEGAISLSLSLCVCVNVCVHACGRVKG